MDKGLDKFYLKNGKELDGLRALAMELSEMADDIFSHHVNEERNDFANWIKYSLKEEKLAERMDKVITRVELELEILRHLIKNDKKKLIKEVDAVKDSSSVVPKKAITKKKVVAVKKTEGVLPENKNTKRKSVVKKKPAQL